MGVTIRLKAVRLRVDRAAVTQEAKKIMTPTVVDFTRQVMNQCIITAPVDTGLLRGQHSMAITESATTIKGTVRNRVKYAAAVHDGSRPHVITGKKMRKPTKGRKTRGVKMLRFEVNGEVVYRRKVMHPGSKARPWMADSAEKLAGRYGYKWRRITTGV